MAESQLIDRREFLDVGLKFGIGTLALGLVPSLLKASGEPEGLLILHTNDVHSRIEPFPMDGGKFQGKGGFSARAAMIDELRKKHRNVLLFDSGDILQGTPYFNRYHGALEFRLMSEMGYNGACIGNHDFDAGIENLAHLAESATFPLICSNYEVKGTPLEGKVKSYAVFKTGKIKTGVYGLGIELNGLVPEQLYGGIRYHNPVERAVWAEEILKKEEKCDFIICLSHLGFRYENSKVSDVVIARETSFTDLILGGHTHTFMQKPEVEENLKGKSVYVFQNGWGGVYLGCIEVGKGTKDSSELKVLNSLSVC
ncbi:MAG: bifunctional metallophosphatase/5'-nucleotidase [Sphingobacteriales bacterium]|nr:bifunctional metallophosphatase/5'-nucleotidase [Sphingobacteriales bacterium]